MTDGYYEFHADDNLNIEVCDENLQSISNSQNGVITAYLEDGKKYFVATQGAGSEYDITIKVQSVTQLSGLLNDKGNIYIEYTPNFDAVYNVTGAQNYVWHTQSMAPTSALFVGSSYYLCITGTPNEAYSIGIAPRAPEMAVGAKYILNTGFYKLVVEADMYIRTYCIYNITSDFKIYNQELTEILMSGSADNEPVYLNLPQGTYYMFLDIHNGRSLTCELLTDNADKTTLCCGSRNLFSLPQNTSKNYTFCCRDTDTYRLRIVTLDSVKKFDLTIFEKNSSQNVSMSTESKKDDFSYIEDSSVELIAGKTYVISISSREDVEGNLVFGVLTRLQQVTLDGQIAYKRGVPASPIEVVMGKEYTFAWTYNNNALALDLDWEILANVNPGKIASKNDNDRLSIGFDASQHNKHVRIRLDDDCGPYTVELILKLPVKTEISISSDYKLTVSLKDVNDNTLPSSVASVSKIKLTWDNQEKIYTDSIVDISYLPIFGTVEIQVMVSIYYDDIVYDYVPFIILSHRN